jgi:hypothetical protein
MEYFKTLTQSDLVGLIQSTKKALYVSMPSIHAEIVDAISYLAYSNDYFNHDVKIHLLIDFDAQTFRQGYGDFTAIERLIRGGFEVKSLMDNRISFLICDDTGYYLFIESRSLVPADKETINAVKIDPVSLVRLKKFFFSTYQAKDFNDELTNAIIEESMQLNKSLDLVDKQIAQVSELTKDAIELVAADLEKNPPLHPDYKRMVEFYSNRFQYVKLKFEGANLKNRKIPLPPKALPIKDATLRKRLETKLNLFDINDGEKPFAPLENFKDRVSALREKYLKKVKSREESLLNKIDKTDFITSLETLKVSLKGLKDQSLIIVQNHIEKTKEKLLRELPEFLAENPKALFPDHPTLWQTNRAYILQEAKSQSKEIIHKIKWPKAHELVEEFNLEVQFSDITFEDLKNSQFRNELKACGLIDEDDVNQLAKFSKGIELKTTQSH